MEWIDTSPVAAEMVEAKVAGDRPDNHLINGSMGNAHTAGASSPTADSALSVTFMLEAAEPLPAAIGDLHF